MTLIDLFNIHPCHAEDLLVGVLQNGLKVSGLTNTQQVGSTDPYLKTELRGPTRTSSDHAREGMHRANTFQTNLL